MSESTAVKLELAAPLYYVRASLAPFAWACKTEAPQTEQLFCFQLDSAQCRSIEPDADKLLGSLLFAGQNFSGAGAPQNETSQKKMTHNEAEATEAAIQLPAGKYLFVQRREALNREACLALAVEQQKDGLWERFALADKLYVRYLFEDGKPVTQLFRPLLI
jgi:hypothetical protein